MRVGALASPSPSLLVLYCLPAEWLGGTLVAEGQGSPITPGSLAGIWVKCRVVIPYVGTCWHVGPF